MVYIVTALYPEAHSLISYYNLKKDVTNTRFQVFRNEDAEICIIITGVGEIAAAAAVASICTLQPPGQGDFLLNIGVCAAVGDGSDIAYTGNDRASHSDRDVCGQIFLCNKLTEQETGRTFYPDMLYRHNFEEGCVVTGRNVLSRVQAAGEKPQYVQQTAGEKPQYVQPSAGEKPQYAQQAGGSRIVGVGLPRVLYDMEAAAVYQSGAYFFAPHQMSFLKVVSDEGDADSVSEEQIGRLMEKNREKIVSYIETLRRAGEEEQRIAKSRGGFGLRQEAAEHQPEISERLCADLHCSAAMRALVQQYLCYCALAGGDYDMIIKRMYEDGRLPCRDRREGKVRLEELKRELL